MSKKQYSIKELSTILGCSVTAVAKKIITDENNPSIKRYRNRYEVVLEDGQMFISLDEQELEEEKRKSKGFKNVVSNVSESSNNVENEEIIDAEVIKEDGKLETLFDVTERYNSRFEELHKYFFERLLDSDKRFYMLEAKDTVKQHDLMQVQKERAFFELNNKKLKRWVYILATLLIVVSTMLITLFITFNLTHINVQTTVENPQPIEEQLQVLKQEYFK